MVIGRWAVKRMAIGADEGFNAKPRRAKGKLGGCGVMNWHTLVGGDDTRPAEGSVAPVVRLGMRWRGLTTTNVRSDSCLVKTSRRRGVGCESKGEYVACRRGMGEGWEA